jgi:ABC-type lipoprotein release transport system permease subunit
LFPIFIAGIDPVQENRLVHLNRTLISGRPLTPSDTFSETQLGSNVPVIASSRTYVSQSLHVTVQRVRVARGVNFNRLLNYHHSFDALHELPGSVVGTESLGSSQMYRGVLTQLEAESIPYIGDFWTTSDVRYDSTSTQGGLRPIPVRNVPADVWFDPQGSGGFYQAPPGNQDTQFRHVTVHNAVLNKLNAGDSLLDIVGRFDPKRLPGFSSLSSVPLETYYPPQAEPVTANSRTALHNEPLRPTGNLGGYIAQPPFMLTTLKGARGFINARFFHGTNAKAPISVIRVRVAGVKGPDRLSQERIRFVAQAIHQRTGLSVDVTAGSSPQPIRIGLPKDSFGQPALDLKENWVAKGVAVKFLKAVDRKSLALFLLVLVVCGLFLVNATLASVRTRRSEIGMLLTIGWSRSQIFRVVLAELVLVGLAAGMLGALLSLALDRMLSLGGPPNRALLVVPVALALAAIAGLFPARAAASGRPIDALHPPVAGNQRSGHTATITMMALRNLTRLPGRTLLGASGLAIGIGALTILVALDRAFQRTLVGTLLGNVISIQVRGVDFLSVVLILLLGVLSVGDVMFLNISDRQAELVTLRTLGWKDSQVAAVVGLEGLGVGLCGSLVGVTLGAVGAVFVAGISVSALLVGASFGIVAGVLASFVASSLPILRIRTLSAPIVLAEE